MAYVQIIALFPNGGGGYQPARRLLHPIAGLVSGSALVVDYTLTIAISVAAASDALLSLTPHAWLQYKPLALAAGLALLVLIVIIICAGEVDAEAYGGHEALERLKQQVGERCAKIVAWSHDHGLLAKVYTGFSTDAVETLEQLCLKARTDHPNMVLVATRPMTRAYSWASTLLHGGAALTLQRRLLAHDAALIVLPMRVDIGPDQYFLGIRGSRGSSRRPIRPTTLQPQFRRRRFRGWYGLT